MSIRRALSFSYLDRYASLIVGFGASVVISRLLTPAEVGAFSVAMVLLGFLSPFRDFGATQFVIQSPVLDDDVLGTVRTLQLILGVVLAGVIVVAAPWVADFYREPAIRGIMLLMALNSLLLPFGALSTALLNREMKLMELAIVRFVGAVVSSGLSIVLAWFDHGPMSLAYGALAGTLSSAIGAILFRPVRVPWQRPSSLSRVVRFGGAMTGTSLLGMVYASVAELALARMQGLAMSGLFGRAQGLVQLLERLLMEGAYGVAVPLFARQLREGRPVGPLYVRSVSLLTAVGWALFGLTACLAEPVIRLLYGEKWMGSVPIAQALCISLSIHAPNLLFSQPLIAMGRAKLVLQTAIWTTGVYATIVLAGASHSLEGACTAIVVAAIVCTGPLLATSRRQLQFSWRAMARALLHSALVAACALVVPVLMLWYSDSSTTLALLTILLSSLGCLVGFIAAAVLTNHPTGQELRRMFDQRTGRQPETGIS